MPLGRKPDKVKAPVIVAPPRITTVDFMSPTGDRYNIERQGDNQLANVALSPLTGQTVQTSQEALSSLADELYAPDPQRIQDIANKSLDYYTLQAQGINTQADDILSEAQSDLAKRFGGTYNSTFGTDYLSRLEQNRLSRLSNATKEATLMGEELYQQDEDSRIQRFQLLNNYLTNEFDKANSVWGTGSNVLENETERAQNLAVTRAQLAQNAMRYNQDTHLKVREQRLDVLKTIAGTALRAMGTFAG